MDVADSIWPILGRAIHKVLEAGADEEHIAEERLFADFDGWIVSGALDLQRRGDVVNVTDYKFTSAYAVLNEKSDWSTQLNSYACLIRKSKGWTVGKLAICAIIRDWSRHRARADSNYPQAPIVMVPIEVWEPERAEEFVRERVRLHREAIARVALGEPLPECSDEDRWMRKTAYCVKKPGAKRAIRLFDTNEEALQYISSNPDLVIEVRRGEPIRCQDYCQVSAWCAQFQKWKGETT